MPSPLRATLPRGTSSAWGGRAQCKRHPFPLPPPTSQLSLATRDEGQRQLTPIYGRGDPHPRITHTTREGRRAALCPHGRGGGGALSARRKWSRWSLALCPRPVPGGGGTGVGGGHGGTDPRHRLGTAPPPAGRGVGGSVARPRRLQGTRGLRGPPLGWWWWGVSGSTRGIRDGGVGRARCPGKPTLPSPRGFNPVPVLPPPRPIVYTARRWFRSWGRPRGGGRRGETTWKLPPSPRGPPPGVTSSPDRWPRP